jgi:endonuclease YncB( thermonuclease family)
MELYAYEAKIYARQQLLNKTVYLAFDYIFRDGFGRLLAYVYFQNGICFNAQLVSHSITCQP